MGKRRFGWAGVLARQQVGSVAAGMNDRQRISGRVIGDLGGLRNAIKQRAG